MAREFSVVVGINATKAVVGGRQFKTGADQVNRSNRSMQRSTARTTKRMTAMITTMGRFRGVASLMFAGFLGVGGISAVIRTISQFETKISQVTALIAAQSPRSLGGAMAALTERARELGATTLFTAGQAAEGMRFLSLAGFDALEVYQAIEPALILATVGMLDLGNAADIVSNIMAAFSIEASDTEDVVNALAFTASRTNTSIQQLGEAMKFVGPVAGALGINVKETSVALGILGNSGLQASLAGTSLRRVMSGLLNPSKEARKVFASMGLTQKELVDTMTGPEGLVNLVELLAEKGIDAADAFLLFGQRGAPGLLSLVNQREKLRDLTEGLKEMGDIAREQAKIIQDNLGGDAKIAISALSEAVITLGKAGFGDFLRETTQSVTGFFRALTGVATPVDEMTESMKKGAKFAELLKDNVELLKVAAHALAAVLLKNLVVGLVRSVAALGASATAAWTNAVAMGASTIATNALTFAVNLLKGALIATGVGALLVGAGLLLQWALSSDDATASAEDLTKAMEDQRIEAEKLIFVFDLLDTADRALAQVAAIKELEIQEKRLATLREEMEQFITVSAGLEAQQRAVTDAQTALNAEVEGTAAFEAARNNLEVQTNAFVTLGEAIGNAGYLELKAEIGELEPSVLALIEDIEAMGLVSAGLAVNMEAARDMIRSVGEVIEEKKPSFEELTGILNEESVAFRELVEEADPMAVALDEVEAKMVLFKKIAGLTDVQLEALKITEEELNKVQAQLNQEMKEASEVLNDVEKAAEELTKAGNKWKETLNDLRGEMDPLTKLEVELARGADDVIAAWIKAEGTAGELAEALKILNDLHEENVKKLEETCEKTDELKECMSENAKAMETIWDQALRNIQDSFADAFRGAFSSFGDFADNILDAFKDLLANMAAQLAISGLLDFFGLGKGGFGGFFGGSGRSGGSGGAAGVVGASAAEAGFSAAFAPFLTAASGFINGATSLLGFGTNLGGSLGILAEGGLAAGVGAFAAGGALGAGSGLITDSILGSRGDQGTTLGLSAIGGAVGSIFGPIGALIGGAIGSFASNLFGGAKALEKATLEFTVGTDGFNANLEKVTSKQKSFFRGRRFTTTNENVDVTAFDQALDSLIDAMTLIAGGLGVDAASALESFTFSRDIDIKGKSEEQIQALLENLFNDVVLGVISTFINNADGLSERLLTTVNLFRGNSEEFLRAFAAAASIDIAFMVDPLARAQEAIAAENATLADTYDELVVAYRELIENFDGSLLALEELAAATQIVTDAQTQLITVLLTVGDQISELFQGSAQTVREALLSEEELFNFRKNKIDELIEQASLTTDPEELSRIATEIDRLGLQNFNLLDEDQQRLLGPEFIEFFDNMDDFFSGRIDEGVSDIIRDQAELDLEVANKMLEAAQAIIDSSNASKDTFDNWRDFIDADRSGQRSELQQ